MDHKNSSTTFAYSNFVDVFQSDSSDNTIRLARLQTVECRARNQAGSILSFLFGVDSMHIITINDIVLKSVEVFSR